MLERLQALPDPPHHIFQSGPIPPACLWVAIVGSRRASAAGRDVARRIARDLARAGAGVISGGALGIDAAAHEGALDGGGPTIVVLPGSIERPYPRANRPLFRRVLESGGVLLSEVSDLSLRRWHFMLRNRIVAALADHVLLVEASARSGTLHTARAAFELGRPVHGWHWPSGDERGAGIHRLVPQGLALLRSPEEMLRRLELALDTASPLDPILALLQGADLPAEVIAAETATPLPAVLARLTHLELTGSIRRVPGGRVRLLHR